MIRRRRGMGDVASDFATAEAADVAKYGPDAAAIYNVMCALTAAGYSPTGPDMYHSQWNNAYGDVIDPFEVASIYPQYANLIGTSCPLPSIPGGQVTDSSQLCPSGWSGTFPACVAPVTPASAIITTGTPGPGILPPANISNPIPVSIQTTPSGSAIVNSSGAAPSGSSSSSSPASWFTDPTQEIVSGFPNWGLVAAAGVALFLALGVKH